MTWLLRTRRDVKRPFPLMNRDEKPAPSAAVTQQSAPSLAWIDEAAETNTAASPLPHRSSLAVEEFEGQLEMLKSELASSKRTVRLKCASRCPLLVTPSHTGSGAVRDEREGEFGGVHAD